MKKILKLAISSLLFGFCAASASANVITLGSVSKNYGSAADRGDKASTGAGSCDTLNAQSITIRDTTGGCRRFSDTFDFSDMNYSSIENLKLTLTFSNTNNFYLFLFPEDWRLIIADSPSHRSNNLMDIANSSGAFTQTFMITAFTHADVFSNISNNGKFYMWFGDEALGANNFNLMSAKLEVNGTAIPEPSSIALFGISLLGAAFARRRAVAKPLA